jgi:hypothetical protein
MIYNSTVSDEDLRNRLSMSLDSTYSSKYGELCGEIMRIEFTKRDASF